MNMVLRKANTRTQFRRMWAGKAKKVTLLKRDDDQKQGTVRAVTLFDCLPAQMGYTKTGEVIQGDMSSYMRLTWKIPAAELERNGVAYINALDRIVETLDDGGVVLPNPRYWQPEGTTSITVTMLENLVSIDCLRVDPPRNIG